MSKRKPSRSKSPSLLEPLLASAVRCHAVGMTLSILLVSATAWIWSNAEFFEQDNRYTFEQLANARLLEQQGDTIRMAYAKSKSLKDKTDARTAEIESWLPSELQWKDTDARIRKLVKSANLEMKTIDQQRQDQVGQRIGINKVTCKLHGSYTDLCRFLDALVKDEQPIWCDRVRIERAPKDSTVKAECAATVSLRVPFAANGTIAAKLRNKPKKKEQQQNGEPKEPGNAA